MTDSLDKLMQGGVSIGVELPLDETLHEIAQEVLPRFHTAGQNGPSSFALEAVANP